VIFTILHKYYAFNPIMAHRYKHTKQMSEDKITELQDNSSKHYHEESSDEIEEVPVKKTKLLVDVLQLPEVHAALRDIFKKYRNDSLDAAEPSSNSYSLLPNASSKSDSSLPNASSKSDSALPEASDKVLIEVEKAQSVQEPVGDISKR
jgi:hypothetical protein